MEIATREPRKVTWPNWDRIQFSPKQASIYNCQSDRILLKAGRAFGKDHVLIFKALVRMFELYYQRMADPYYERRDDCVVKFIVVAPTDTNSSDLWDRLINGLPDIPGIAFNGKANIHIKHDAREIEIFGKGQIEIQFLSTFKANNLRGRGTDMLLITECAYHDEDNIIRVLFPFCMRPGYAGIIYMNSTPRGRGHWFDKYILEMRKGIGYMVDLGFVLFEGTFHDNPRADDKDKLSLDAMLKKNVYAARMEILGWLNVPVVSSAMMGEGVELAFPDKISPILLNRMVRTEGPYVVGLDLATTGDDHLGVCVLDRNGVVVRLERHSKTNLEQIIDIVVRINEMFHPRAICYDANMGILRNVKNGRLASIPLKPITITDKHILVEHLEQHIISRTIRIYDPEFVMMPGKYQPENYNRLINELESYRKFTVRKDQVKHSKIVQKSFVTYHKPPDGTDDLLDALVYAAHNITVPFKVKTLADHEEVREIAQPVGVTAGAMHGRLQPDRPRNNGFGGGFGFGGNGF